MLKITQTRAADGKVLLRLEGRLGGPWVAETRDACERLLAEGCPVQLNLAEVAFLDAGGAGLLASLQRRGVCLTECPPFVAEQLKAASGESV